MQRDFQESRYRSTVIVNPVLSSYSIFSSYIHEHGILSLQLLVHNPIFPLKCSKKTRLLCFYKTAKQNNFVK
jgi:hypothetical protein